MNYKKIILRSLGYSLLVLGLLLGILISAVFFFKDQIINSTVQELNKYLDTKIEVSPDIQVSAWEKFPSIALQFKNVKVYEHPSLGTRQLAEAEKLYFAFDLMNFIRSKYVIDELYMENGFIKIRIDSMGQVNYNIIKPSKEVSTGKEINFKLERIALNNVVASYENQLSQQFHEVLFYKANAALHLDKDNYSILVNTNAEVNAISVGNRAYFKGKEINATIHLTYQVQEQLITIQPSTIEVEDAKLSIAGMFQSKDTRFIDLEVKEEQGSIQTILSLLPENLYNEFRAYQSDGEVFLTAHVKGEVRNNLSPMIEVHFGFKEATFYHPELHKKITHAHLKGYFTNGHLRRSQSSTLRLENIACTMDGRQLRGNFTLHNFDDPHIQCDVNGSVDINFIAGFYTMSLLEQAKGVVDFNAKFDGRINDLKNKSTMEKVNAEGEITFQDLMIKLKNVPYSFSQLKGNVQFNNNDVSISNCSGIAGKSDFEVNLMLKNFISSLVFNKRTMAIEGTLKSNYLDANELLTYMPSATNTNPVVASANTSTKEAVQEEEAFKLYRNALFKLDCSVGHVKYYKVNAHKVNADFTMVYPKVYLNNVTFDAAGGNVKTSATLHFQDTHTIEASTHTALTNINIDSVFYVFDNFNQTFITQHHLRGEYTGVMDVLFVMNEKLDVDANSVVASIEANIVNGELNNFDPMKKLSKFIQEEKLAHIQFSELKNKIFIEKGVISIPEMGIKTNVSHMQISGTHTIDQKIDYRLSLPISNFIKKRHDSDEAFGAIQEDKKGETRLFLTIKGTTENYKIAYDAQRTQQKIKEDLKKEKEEFLQLFKKKDHEDVKQETKQQEQQFFDFDN